MPGGSPQGALLGVLLYLVYVSDVGMDMPEALPTVPGVVDIPSIPFPPPPAVSESEARLKFVDDLSLAESVSLDSQLVISNAELVLPPAESILQNRLNEVALTADYHDMKFNLDKTKIMVFNFTRKYQFEPEMSLDGEVLDVVNETMLLGLTVTSDCKWDKHIKLTVTKGNSRLWFLRRLKLLGASVETMVEIYKLFCRSVLEYGAPVWTSSLKRGNINSLERVQKNALKIIHGSDFPGYHEALEEMDEQTLQSRRVKLSLRFAEACLKDTKFRDWFKIGVSTRSGIIYQEPEAKTGRYRNSAIPYLTRLLNSRIR